MNIIEAIKSGKRFKRKDCVDYYDDEKDSLYFVMDEVMAEDWEVEPDTVTITRKQFDAAWRKAITKTDRGPYIDIKDAIAAELGL